MMKKAHILIALLLCIATVSAGTVFEGNVKDNEPFYIGGVKHVAKFYPSADKLSLSVGEDRLLIKKSDCETLEQRQYCLDNVDESYDEETGDPISVSHIRIIEFGPEISVDVDVGDKTPLINEETTVTVTISNTGTERATNVNYEERFPVDATIQGSTVNKALNMVEWTGNLDPGKSQTFTYTVKFKEFVTYTSTPKLTYVKEGKVLTKDVEKTDYEVQRPYTATIGLSSKSVALNEDMVYTLKVENHGTDSIDIDANINLPSSAQIVKRDRSFEGLPPNLEYHGAVAGGKEVSVNLTFRVTKKGQYKATTKVTVRSPKYLFDETEEIPFSVGVSQIEASVNLSPNPVKSGSEFMAEVKVHNSGDEAITVSKINFGGNYSDPRGWRDVVIEPGDNYYAMNKLVYAPIVYEDVDYSFKISGEYTKGTTFSFSVEDILKVNAFEKVVDFQERYFVSNESADAKYLNMTVTVKNVVDYELTSVTAIDALPKGYKMIAGARDYDGEKLSPGDEISYSYIMRMPKDAEKFKITHTFNAEPDVIFEMPVEIDLSAELEEGEETGLVEKPAEEPANETVAEKETAVEPEKGFFAKVWDWLFGWI